MKRPPQPVHVYQDSITGKTVAFCSKCSQALATWEQTIEQLLAATEGVEVTV